MAYLVDNEVIDSMSDMMDGLSKRFEPIGVTKPELKSALVAIDAYIEDNAALINTSIPQPARTNLTKSQKAEIMVFILTKRYKVGA